MGNSKDDDNVVQFPIVNKRFDVSNIALDPEEVADKIKLMKLTYFATMSDEIVEDALRALAQLRLNETPVDTNPIESGDLILLKEAFVSTMCRIVGIEHPLHQIIEDNIVISLEDVDDYDETFYNYRFKSEPSKND